MNEVLYCVVTYQVTLICITGSQLDKPVASLAVSSLYTYMYYALCIL